MTKNFILRGFVTFFILSCTRAIKENCNQDDLITKCNMPLPVLSSPDISFALTREELDKSCVDLRSGIRCINNFTEICMEKNERTLFRSIYSGITEVIEELCMRGSYQDEYLKHADCVKNVRPEYERCSKQYEVTLTRVSDSQNTAGYSTDGRMQANHEDYLKTVCCSFHDYLVCSERTVRNTCGDEAAVFTSAFLKRMASNIIKSYCFEYRGQECDLSNKSNYNENSLLLLGTGLFAHVLLKYAGHAVW